MSEPLAYLSGLWGAARSSHRTGASQDHPFRRETDRNRRAADPRGEGWPSLRAMLCAGGGPVRTAEEQNMAQRELVGQGRTADVYAWEDGRVLKLFRLESPPASR
jgi:hypothetical protein